MKSIYKKVGKYLPYYKKMKIKSIACYFVILLFLGCNSDTNDDYYHSKFIQNYKLKELDSLKFINNDSLFISQTGDMRVWKNHIFISDFNFMKVWIFDKNLNLVTVLGGKGRGPQEYVYPPNILGADNYLLLIDSKFRNINIYDEDFNFIKKVKLPDKIVFPPYGAVYNGKNFIFFGFKPEDFSYENLSNIPSLFALDKNFDLANEFFPWDKMYNNNTAYVLDNLKVLLTKDKSTGFFTKQTGLFKISYFDKNFHVIKNFGRKPKYFKEPPDIKFEDTQRSAEAASDFSSKTTKFLKIYYDKISEHLLVNYVNLDKDFFYARTLLLGKHYLQIYDKNYNCIYDGPIPGKLAFAMHGKIYILTDERPEFIMFKIFKLVKK